MTTNETDRIDDLLQKVTSALDKLQGQIDQMQKTIDDLEAQGVKNASLWWKDGKYLYLVYPVDREGKRVREYIGSKQDAVKDAEAAVNRYLAWDKLQTKIRVLRDRQRNEVNALKNILYRLNSKQATLWGE